MKKLLSLYPSGSVNEKRLSTDKQFIDEKAVFSFDGILDRAARFVESFHLTDPTVWARFVDQFRLFSDTEDYGWRGEYWGKMMRGASFVYSYTKNEELYCTLTQTVEDMLSAADGSGRISTYKTDNELVGWDIWCRKYVLLGMQYFMEICRDDAMKKRIVGSMCRQTDYIMERIGKGKMNITKTANCWRGLASSSILEPVVRLYDLTGEKKYLDFAEYIIDAGGTCIADIFEIAFEDKTDPYQYPITKAYEMISCFEGMLEYYRVTGIEKYKTTVMNFARRLAKTDITIIGSAGCTSEYFDHSAARQTDTAYRGIMQETCVTVTWMKFCMQLLMLTGESSFADEFECSLYNAYLGAVNTEKKENSSIVENFPNAVVEPLPFDSYSALLSGTRGREIGGMKVMPDNRYYGCCACIGSAGIGMAHKVALTARRDGVCVNLFVPGTVSTVTPDGAGLKLVTDTAYPADGRVKITVMTDLPETFTLALRIPRWSCETSLYVCGKEIETTPGTYAEIKREWNEGDTIELELDMHTRALHPIPNPRDLIFTDVRWEEAYMVPHVVTESPDARYHIALRRGPIVLARDARLGENVDEPVDVEYDENDVASTAPFDGVGFPCTVSFKVKERSGAEFTVVDYASAGKTWGEDSRYACWLPTVNPLKISAG